MYIYHFHLSLNRECNNLTHQITKLCCRLQLTLICKTQSTYGDCDAVSWPSQRKSTGFKTIITLEFLYTRRFINTKNEGNFLVFNFSPNISVDCGTSSTVKENCAHKAPQNRRKNVNQGGQRRTINKTIQNLKYSTLYLVLWYKLVQTTKCLLPNRNRLRKYNISVTYYCSK